MVLYIVHENSHNPHFGFCSFALELLNFFIDMFKKNIEFYTTESGFDKAEFINHQKSYKKKYHEYRSIFYQGIYESSGKYSENELYEFLKGL